MKKNALSWILYSKQPIIHRGMINQACLEHSRSAFQLCIEHGYPMEVDLLMLRDQQIIVWREETVDAGTNKNCLLSSMTLQEIRMIANGNPDSRLNQMMTLEEFVSLVNGKVGVIFEIKVPYESSVDATVNAVLSVLAEYRGEFAIHSSNPYVIRRIRALCPDIAIGQISLSFKWIPNVSPEYVRLHREFLFADIIMPDFLDYDIRDLAEGETRDKALDFCRQHGIPLLSWTIKNATEEHLARKHCSNYIIEGATSYIN